jgi:TonB-dependent starch-binding outer membrane protein SusC
VSHFNGVTTMPALHPRALFVSLLLGVLSLTVPSGASAQSRGVVFGMVVDEMTDVPIRGAEVEILGGKIRRKTDDLGMFVLPDLPVGQINLRVEKGGYSKVVEQVQISEGGLADLQVRLLPMAVALEQLLVTGQRVRRTGYSITELKADPTSDQTAADLLAANVPGVRIAVDRGVGGTRADVGIRGTASFIMRTTPAIYLDGILISEYLSSGARGANALSVLGMIPASEVERIFVLRGPSAGAQYPQADGAIVIETRGRR